MADPKLTITAVDQTKAAFASVAKNLDGMKGQFSAVTNLIGGVHGKILALAASLGGIGLVVDVRSAIDAADQINKLSQRTGIAVENLSSLKFAAELADVDIATLANGIKKLSVNMADAQRGTGEAVDAFKALGVNVKDAQGGLRSTDDVLLELADKFSKFEDGANKTALAVQIFGRAGDQLIPFLNQGATGIAELRKEAERLGITMSGETAKSAEAFNDNLKAIGESAKGLGRALAASMLPSLVEITNQMRLAAQEGGFLAAVWAGLKEVVIQTFGGNAQSNLRDANKAIADQLVLIEKLETTEARRGTLNTGNREKQITAAKQELDRLKGEALKAQELLKFSTPGGLNPPPAPKAAAPALPSKASMSTVRDTARDLLSGILQDLQRDIAQAQAQLTDRLGFLEEAFKDNLLSIEDYYERRRNAQQEATAETIAALDKEQKALEQFRDRPGAKPEERIQAENQIRTVIEKRAAVEERAAISGIKLWREEQNAVENYKRAVQDVNIQILELQGSLAEAARARFSVQTKDIREKATQQQDQRTLDNLDILEREAGIKADINRITQDAGIIQDQLRNAEDRTEIARKRGTRSELQVLRESDAARQATVTQLLQIAEAYDAIAASSADKRLKQNAENFRVEIEKLEASASQLRDKFEQIGTNAFSDFLSDAITGTKTLKEAFKDMVNSIVSQISRLAAQDIAGSLFGKPGVIDESGAFGGLSGIFGKGIDWLTGIFGGAADGAALRAGQPMVVGERGPELFVPSMAGNVIPNGAGMGAVTMNFYLAEPATQRTQQQVGQAAYDGMLRARQRNG